MRDQVLPKLQHFFVLYRVYKKLTKFNKACFFSSTAADSQKRCNERLSPNEDKVISKPWVCMGFQFVLSKTLPLLLL